MNYQTSPSWDKYGVPWFTGCRHSIPCSLQPLQGWLPFTDNILTRQITFLISMSSLRHWSKERLCFALPGWQWFLFYKNKSHMDKFLSQMLQQFLRENKKQHLNREGKKKKKGRHRKIESSPMEISVTRFKYLKMLNLLSDWNSL